MSSVHARRTIMVHSLEHARAAIAAARRLGVPLRLASAPGAAAMTGPLWFHHLVRRALTEESSVAGPENGPEVEITAVLDCADEPGQVFAALRSGLTQVRFTGSKAIAKKLSAVAAAQGANVITGDLHALDLLSHPNPQEACQLWLSRR